MASERVSFTDLIETFKAMAISCALEPSEASIYRHYCRKYSMAFHTPLSEVLKLETEHVIQHVLEHQMDSLDLDENMESLLQMIYQIEDPTYDAKAEEEEAEYAALAEEEEKERLREGRKVGAVRKKPKAPEPELPKEGGVNFGYLEESENER